MRFKGLSNNIMSRRTNDLTNDVEGELLKTIKLNYFAIMLYKSTYVTKATVLLVYIRCILRISFNMMYYSKHLWKLYKWKRNFRLFQWLILKQMWNKLFIRSRYVHRWCKRNAMKYYCGGIKKITAVILWIHCCMLSQEMTYKRILSNLSLI